MRTCLKWTQIRCSLFLGLPTTYVKRYLHSNPGSYIFHLSVDSRCEAPWAHVPLPKRWRNMYKRWKICHHMCIKRRRNTSIQRRTVRFNPIYIPHALRAYDQRGTISFGDANSPSTRRNGRNCHVKPPYVFWSLKIFVIAIVGAQCEQILWYMCLRLRLMSKESWNQSHEKSLKQNHTF